MVSDPIASAHWSATAAESAVSPDLTRRIAGWITAAVAGTGRSDAGGSARMRT